MQEIDLHNAEAVAVFFFFLHATMVHFISRAKIFSFILYLLISEFLFPKFDWCYGLKKQGMSSVFQKPFAISCFLWEGALNLKNYPKEG